MKYGRSKQQYAVQKWSVVHKKKRDCSRPAGHTSNADEKINVQITIHSPDDASRQRSADGVPAEGYVSGHIMSKHSLTDTGNAAQCCACKNTVITMQKGLSGIFIIKFIFSLQTFRSFIRRKTFQMESYAFLKFLNNFLQSVGSCENIQSGAP